MSNIKNCALNLLAFREHSQAELRVKLLSKGYNINDISEILPILINENAQSDERFTESYIRMRANRGYGPLHIRFELIERGISEEIIDKTIDLNNQFWSDNALKVWQKKFGNKIPTTFEEKAKQMKFLQYRGFNSEQIKKVFARINE